MKLYKYVLPLTFLISLLAVLLILGGNLKDFSNTAVSASSEEIGITVEDAVQASVIGEPYCVGETFDEDLTEKITESAN